MREWIHLLLEAAQKRPKTAAHGHDIRKKENKHLIPHFEVPFYN